MDLKNQLTKTPYLVLFIVLISVGVGTASALITITLAGDVHITGDTTIDGELSVGTGNPNDDDKIWFDDGNEFLMWDDSQSQFEIRDDLVTGDVIQSGNAGPNVAYNRIGIGNADSGFVTTNDDLYIKGDLEIDGGIYCPNCILGVYRESIGTSGNDDILTITVGCDEGDQATGGGDEIDDFSNITGPVSSRPAGTLSWEVVWINTDENEDYRAFVICLDYSPAHVN